jgi:SAM-dependent methyltransferase
VSASADAQRQAEGIDGHRWRLHFGPVHQTTLQLALQHRPQAQRVLDVGCGTGQLLRCARPYPAELASLLAAQRLAVVGCARTRWFRLPDVQVIAARRMTRRG